MSLSFRKSWWARFCVFVLAVGAGFAVACSSGHTYTDPPPDNIPCNADTDCCVVVDECRAAAYVVHAGDTVQRPPLNASGACMGCSAPAVQVWCENGLCKSGTVPSAPSPYVYPLADKTLFSNHCGPAPLPDGGYVLLPDGGIIDGGWKTLAAYGCAP